MKPSFDVESLTLQHLAVRQRQADAAFGRLLNDVLESDRGLPSSADPWTVFAFFEPGGRCVAGLEAAVLTLILDGERRWTGAIRSVATDEAWRGRGLFRRLMTAGLEWCGAKAPIVMLFTEIPELYEGFGFRTVPQHAFAGPAPAASGRSAGRVIRLADEDDRELVRALVCRRMPISARCALVVDAPLLIANLVKDDALTLLHDDDSDALVVFERNQDELVLVDVVAPQIPTLATLMRLLPETSSSQVKCLFPTDKLDWDGVPTPEETGLMIRGPIPPRMARPFMFPPTAEF